VLDPIDNTVTHLIVQPEHGHGLGRLIPIAWATAHDDRVDLGCTRAEFERLEIAEVVRFLPSALGYMGLAPENVLLWPYLGPASEVPTLVPKERCESGRIGLTANELTWETGSEGSNPSLSAARRFSKRALVVIEALAGWPGLLRTDRTAFAALIAVLLV
jgi:hypothetical protein